METQTPEWFYKFLPLIIVLALFDFVLKLIAMWRAGRNNQLSWFILIALLNTVGILPIIYLFKNRKKKTQEN
ncbi:MAG: DUF5652 family protein [Bacteroidales bacterium]|nr:DUF5652 family protein [Bacteroidales bacterium]